MSIVLVYLGLSTFFPCRDDNIPLMRERWKGNWVTRIYRRTGYFPHVQADGVWIIKKIVHPYFAPNLSGKCYRRVRKWALDITPTVSAKHPPFSFELYNESHFKSSAEVYIKCKIHIATHIF